MAVTAAGAFRRTPGERADQRLAWNRADQPFFAAGACHILAWVCRDTYPDRPIGLAGLRFAGERQVFHVYATWADWAFDHAGWNPEADLLAANREFERRPLDRIAIAGDLATFCRAQHHRTPHQYFGDPLARARDYVNRHPPPWA
ncbi:hypothetical protein ACGFLT_23445 [Micromonospora chalcea]|uniref:hypothetical protein n=1 Tax=unclassified Micromonospora TaxID=2617518 RepID=UPI000E30ABC3|nr:MULTISPECIES: hypothetical protein [unclassified Micromonospora]AXO36056.1 hypothetical protein MicB006_3778 [Micromonospora sp. B006]MBQ1042436.1 hypothetical protein [Micromonospora sp. C72]MBQ1055758.1 hypothetical protein [Micromonospora sp. C32]